MNHVVIVGCGVIGAAIAYELSRVPGLKVTVIDKHSPASAATKAALGVLMGVISHKIKGKAWQMRQTSIQRYETLIPELEALTGHQIPFNRQGILMLLPRDEPTNEIENLAFWEKLVTTRASQGWQLEIWDAAQIKSRCPQINCEQIQTAVYSPQDRQVDPNRLTLALVEAAKRNGVTFHFGATVTGYDLSSTSNNQHCVRQIQLKSSGESQPIIQNVDWLVMATGLGTPQFLRELGAQIVDIKPVLGQAIHLKLDHPLGDLDFQPAISGNDVHIVPCGAGTQATHYWVGATVEFAPQPNILAAAPLEDVLQQAIAFCPALAEATVVRTWSGLRPRPEGRPAPVIGPLPGYDNVLLATGHYRNGVLLAPATAQIIRQMVTSFTNC